MMNYNENLKLNEMIDMNSNSVYALACRLNVQTDAMMDMLSSDYEAATENGTVISDSDGISFETEYASITLKKNQDFGSSYEYYLKFNTKNGCRSESPLPDMSWLPDTLDQVNLNTGNMERLNQFVNGNDDEPVEELLSSLKTGYLTAKQDNSFKPYGSGFTFNTGLKTQRGEAINASVRLGWDGTWFLNYVGYENIYTPNYFNAAIREFADLDDTYLADIAALAKAEKWYFGDESGKYDILQNYISYTFYRLKQEDKISINRTGDFAAFNTGLASAAYDDIYMCFKRKSGNDDQKWTYAGVCTEKSGTVWKKLISSFNPLPEPAQYFVRKEDILFDMNKTVYTDSEHIIYDRLHRIPAAFLRQSFLNNARGVELLDRIERGMNIAESFDELKEIVRENEDIFGDLSNRLEQLVAKTVRIIRWNYRLAIPSYYPKGNAMSLLLPLDFTDCGTAQAALVVQMTESGNYIGHTLLNMRQAYLNARLISSQESSWLTA